MRGVSVRSTWAMMTWVVIIGLLTTLIAVRPAQARRWSMMDGIGPRPAFDADSVFCQDGMQLGVALVSAGDLHLKVELFGQTLYEDTIRIDLPIEIGSLRDETIEPGQPEVYYEYRVSDYFRMNWTPPNRAGQAKMSFGPNLEWFKYVQIGFCNLGVSAPSAEIVQVGPGSTSSKAVGSLVFEATARDAEVGPNKGDGVYALEMQVEDMSGTVVYRTVSEYPRYGAFGGGCGSCTLGAWVFVDHDFRWPWSNLPIRSGAHKLVVVVHTLKGVKLRVTKDITVDAHQARSYRTATPPVIDGSLSEWGSAAVIPLNSLVTATRVGWQPSPANSSATVRSLWTASTLYFAISVTDDKLWNDGPQPWHDDEIEIGIDGLRDGVGTGVDDHQYTANPDGRQTDQGTPTSAFQMKTRARIDGWDAEFAIPVGHLKAGTLAAGKVMGFNLGLRDDDDGGDSERQQVWAGTTTYRVEPSWGALTLVDTAAPTVTPTPVGRPTATPTPRGDTLALQTGLNGYNGVQDTFIDKAAPNTNNSGWVKLRLQDESSPEAMSSLLRFDLSSLPKGAKVYRATLSLWPFERSGVDGIHTWIGWLKRDWSETEATWVHARTGVSWESPGAAGANDIGGWIAAQDFWTEDAWFGFDVTALVRSWVAGSLPNYGLIVRASAPEFPALTYDIVPSNSAAVRQAYRPELIVSYWSPNRVYLPFTQK